MLVRVVRDVRDVSILFGVVQCLKDVQPSENDILEVRFRWMFKERVGLQ